MCKSGKCSMMAHFGSMVTWFLSASRRVTQPQFIFSSIRRLLDEPSLEKALMKSFLTLASRIRSNASIILSAFCNKYQRYNVCKIFCKVWQNNWRPETVLIEQKEHISLCCAYPSSPNQLPVFVID